MMLKGLTAQALSDRAHNYSIVVDANEFTLPAEIDDQKAIAIQNELLSMDQIDAPVTHHFGEGIYIREVTLPAGSMVMGRKHRNQHMNIMLEGRIAFYGEDGWVEMEAPQTFISPAGRKVAFIYEKTTWQNVYATTETNLEKLEAFIFDDDEQSARALKGRLPSPPNVSEDVLDYYDAIKEYGFTHEQVQMLTNIKEDQIPFPHGSYQVTVSDSALDGKGLFATANFERGETICIGRLDGLRTPAGRYTNHAKVPNAQPVLVDGNVYLIALRSIQGYRGGQVGEEITIDYRAALELEGSCQA